MGDKFTISRYWNGPKIYYELTNDKIQLQIGFEDFIYALKAELDSPLWMFKKETLDKQIDEAAHIVLKRVKEESAKIV